MRNERVYEHRAKGELRESGRFKSWANSVSDSDRDCESSRLVVVPRGIKAVRVGRDRAKSVANCSMNLNLKPKPKFDGDKKEFSPLETLDGLAVQVGENRVPAVAPTEKCTRQICVLPSELGIGFSDSARTFYVQFRDVLTKRNDSVTFSVAWKPASFSLNAASSPPPRSARVKDSRRSSSTIPRKSRVREFPHFPTELRECG
jgi:hypothetical protein